MEAENKKGHYVTRNGKIYGPYFKTDTASRTVQGVLPPSLNKIFDEYVSKTDEKESQVIVEALTQFFRSKGLIKHR